MSPSPRPKMTPDLESIVVVTTQLTQLEKLEQSAKDEAAFPQLPDEIWRLILELKKNHEAESKKLERRKIEEMEDTEKRSGRSERSDCVNKLCCKCCVVNWLAAGLVVVFVVCVTM